MEINERNGRLLKMETNTHAHHFDRNDGLRSIGNWIFQFVRKSKLILQVFREAEKSILACLDFSAT